MSSHSFRALVFRLACALALAAVPARAQTSAVKPPPSLGEKTSEAISQMRHLQEGKEWQAMLKLLDGIPGIAPGSYDEAIVLDMKARIYSMLEQPARAIPLWERALAVSQPHGYFNERQQQEIVLYLAHLHSQELSATKDKAAQQAAARKALGYFKRYLGKSTSPPPDILNGYATMLFYVATADPARIDQAMLQEAQQAIREGLLQSVKPREGFFHLQLAVLQQQDDLAGASDLIELLLRQKPNQKDFWPVLMSFYVQLSDRVKPDNPRQAREYLVRAILTYERAQFLGFLASPKDRLHHASLYLATDQFSKGTELLHTGLRQGTIDSDPANWRLLGHYYYEANQPEQAIAVLREAGGLFPRNSEIEVQLAQLHVQLERYPVALGHARAALEKNTFETTKPFAMHNLIAYLCYELGQLDEAQAAIAAGEKFPAEAAKDPQFAQVKAGIAEALQDRTQREQRRAGTPPQAASVRTP